ncbi:MAG: tyrosine--tRNA ligase [Buchnera aphidicola (Periphyllus aceris)]|nr:tyrosine--tRNA ligase [Buchnera aphidicola (Periphyllus aceris)]
MLKKKIFTELKKRLLISQITNEKKVEDFLNNQCISVYCGFDPTADSLHIGHILPLLFLKRLQLKGHKPIILIGGSTSLIGDPSFKLKERKFFSLNNTSTWIKKIINQISLFLDFTKKYNKPIILNNSSWFRKLNIISFLRDIGKHFSISKMINKESVKNRINRHKQGISFTEFSYSLLQAYDFSYLYKKYQVMLQIGGSDQWGNITSGISLTHYLHKSEVFGLTLPLLTQSSGQKFGKSELKTIWLDPDKTTPYEFYQFWVNTTDQNVYDYLKYFTFISLKRIKKMKKNDELNKTFIQSKEILAKYLTCLVHGNKNYYFSKKVSKIFFKKKLDGLTLKDFKKLIKYKSPSLVLEKREYSLQEALYLTELATSYRHAKDLIFSNSITINYKKQNNINYVFLNTDKFFHKYTIICRGKKKYFLLIWR